MPKYKILFDGISSLSIGFILYCISITTVYEIPTISSYGLCHSLHCDKGASYLFSCQWNGCGFATGDPFTLILYDSVKTNASFLSLSTHWIQEHHRGRIDSWTMTDSHTAGWHTNNSLVRILHSTLILFSRYVMDLYLGINIKFPHAVYLRIHNDPVFQDLCLHHRLCRLWMLIFKSRYLTYVDKNA